MQNFFSSKFFKILVAVVVILAGVMVYSASNPKVATISEKAMTFITLPLQKLVSGITGSVGDFFGNIFGASKIAEENDALKSELDDLRNKLIDYETYKAENEQLRDFLQLKKDNPDYQMLSAEVVGRDVDDFGTTFMIDKGSMHGVSLRDAVVTPSGLIGVVEEVYPTGAKVSTILHSDVKIGAQIIRTRDTCVTEGSASLARDGKLKLSYIPRESEASKGDLVVTSGVSGIYPKNLVIGLIEEVRLQENGVSLYAVISPIDDLSAIKDVFLITDFFGKQKEPQ